MAASDLMAQWTLVQHNTSFEYTYSGWAPVITLRREVETKTWECTIKDDSSWEPSASDNPGGLDNTWKLESCEYSRTLSQPLSKTGRITYTKKGAWSQQ